MPFPIQRIDLVSAGHLNEHRAKYPIGKIIQMYDVDGNEKSYLVKDVATDAAATFHPDTDESFYRVVVTLELQ